MSVSRKLWLLESGSVTWLVLLFEYIHITGLGYFIRITHINWIEKVWVDLINERQQETHALLGKKSKFHGINLLREQWVHPENYDYLNPTQLLDLCCSVPQLILCILELFWTTLPAEYKKWTFLYLNKIYFSYFQLAKKLKRFHSSFLRKWLLKTDNKRLQKGL